MIIVIICMSTALTYAGGSSDTSTKPGQGTVQVNGRVRLVGSAPLYNLVITSEDREWYIIREEQDKLWLYQQQTVRVKATEYYLDLEFANGSPAGRRYFLKDIRIISPKTGP